MPERKTIYLKRFSEDANTTYGVILREDGTPLCFTLENPWKSNIPFMSRIPSGTYKCSKFYSRKFEMETFIIEVGQGRSGCIFHPGNTHLDTHGCVLPVTVFGPIKRRLGQTLQSPIYGGLGSREAFRNLMNYLQTIINSDFEFNLRIIYPYSE